MDPVFIFPAAIALYLTLFVGVAKLSDHLTSRRLDAAVVEAARICRAGCGRYPDCGDTCRECFVSISMEIHETLNPWLRIGL